MSDRETLPARTSPTSAAAPSPDAPLLTRLNAHGLRLVQLADALLLLAIMVGTMVARQALAGESLWQWRTYSMPLYALSFLSITALFATTYYFGGLYEREPRLGYPPALPRVTRLSLAATGLFAFAELGLTSLLAELGLVDDARRALPMPFPNLIVLFILGSVGVAANRRLVHWARANREGPPRVLLVGAPDEVNVARSHVDSDSERAIVVGAMSDPVGLIDRVRQTGATEVMLLSGRWLDTLYPDALRTLEEAQVNVLQRVTAKETMFGLERVRQVGGMPFVQLRSHTMANSRARFKRFTDLVALVLAAPAVVPLLGVVALYQLIAVGRPVLFWQERVGVEGRRFRMVKFRTMYPDAEEDGNPRLATQDDPRIVPACRWLRATRLDELPQVYNVLRGEMSLVGPRPERPELTEQFASVIPGYDRRHEIPPGITGLAQIHGHYHTDPEYKLGYDLQYLVNWSPVLDVEIVARTVWVVLARRI